MKKLLLILLCLPMIGFGQSEKGSNQIYFSSGLNISHDFYNYKDNTPFKNHYFSKYYSMYFSLSADLLKIGDLLLETGVAFNRRGVSDTYEAFIISHLPPPSPINAGEVTWYEYSDYISINPILKYSIFKKEKINFYILSGLQGDILINEGEGRKSENEQLLNEAGYSPVFNHFSTSLFITGVNLGFGVSKRFKNIVIGFENKLWHNIYNKHKSPEWDTSIQPDTGEIDYPEWKAKSYSFVSSIKIGIDINAFKNKKQ